MWGLPSHFSIPYPLTPNLCPRMYMIGCIVKVFPLMVNRKWTLLWILILVGLGQGLLPKMQRPHFQYTSFTPLVQLGLDLNQKGNLSLGSPLCKVWKNTYVFPVLMCKWWGHCGMLLKQPIPKKRLYSKMFSMQRSRSCIWKTNYTKH